MSSAPSRSQPCPHGKTAICRFIDKNGNGCRWGDACHFCHVCKRVTTYNRIQQVLAGRRQARTPTASVSKPSGTVVASGIGLVGLLTTCPELLLEGFLGEAFSPEAIAALPSVHPSLAALIAGGASLLFWRLQLRRLRVSGLELSGELLNSLSVEELRRVARAFGGRSPVIFKSRWHFEALEALLDAVLAVERARDDAAAGSQMFAFTFRYHHRIFDDDVAGDNDGAINAPDNVVAPLPALDGDGDQSDVREDDVIGSHPIEGDTLGFEQNAVEAESPTLYDDSVVDPLSALDSVGDQDDVSESNINGSPLVEGDEQAFEDNGVEEDSMMLPPDSPEDFHVRDNGELGFFGSSTCFYPVNDGSDLKLPDGSCFNVVPMIERNRSGRKARYSLMPACWSPGPHTARMLPRNMELEASLWSASPSICAFEDLGVRNGPVGAVRALSPSEVNALLCPQVSANAATNGDPPMPSLRVITAIRCLQRFWQLTLE